MGPCILADFLLFAGSLVGLLAVRLLACSFVRSVVVVLLLSDLTNSHLSASPILPSKGPRRWHLVGALLRLQREFVVSLRARRKGGGGAGPENLLARRVALGMRRMLRPTLVS